MVQPKSSSQGSPDKQAPFLSMPSKQAKLTLTSETLMGASFLTSLVSGQNTNLLRHINSKLRLKSWPQKSTAKVLVKSKHFTGLLWGSSKSWMTSLDVYKMENPRKLLRKGSVKFTWNSKPFKILLTRTNLAKEMRLLKMLVTSWDKASYHLFRSRSYLTKLSSAWKSRISSPSRNNNKSSSLNRH